jgi:hypothetical protein
MFISDLKKNDDGSYKMGFTASNEEMQYLATFAINSLLHLGIISIEEGETNKEVQFLDKMKHTLQ